MAVTFIPVNSREDFDSYRSNGVGASEIGTLFGLNEYDCKLSLHHTKLGIKKSKSRNLRMNIGHISENVTSVLYESYNKDETKFLYNLEHGVKERKIESVNAYCINSKYKNIFVSLDRREIYEDSTFGCVELKNKTYGAYAKWESKMNPCETLQLSTQIMVTEYKRGNIVYFVDNSKLDVFPMLDSDAKKLEKSIVSTVDKFWSNVEESRMVMTQIHHAKSNHNMRQVEELIVKLYSLEPEPEYNLAYLSYMTELSLAKKDSVPMKGTSELFELAKKHKVVSDKIKKLELQKIEYAAIIAKEMGDFKEIDFGKNGKVSLFGRFSNKIKL